MVTNLLAYLIAIAIPLLAIYVIYSLNIFSLKETNTVALSMVWGATFAFGLSYLANTATATVLPFETVVTRTAPIVEEILKAAVLVYFIQSPRFRYVVDGAIYGFGAGIGFAVTENIFYLSGNPDAALTLAISRVLSTALMHATASALVGISLGRLRREAGRTRLALPLIGILVAIVLHIIYNSLVTELTGPALLLVAISIGLGGSILIGWQINQSIQAEKASFTATLSRSLNVAGGERMAVQRLGGAAIEEEFQALADKFGAENIDPIRRLLVTQANIGILQNNLALPNVSPRLREAWETELTSLKAAVTTLRDQMRLDVSLYLRTLFPPQDDALWDMINAELADYDPTLINKFDMFMRVSNVAASITAEQQAALARQLQSITIFQYVETIYLENLSRALESVTFDDHALIFDQGDDGDAMYLIEQGAIAVYTVGKDGTENHFRTFEAGRVVGDFAVLDGKPRSARARAQQHLRAWKLSRQAFMMFIQSRPQVITAIMQALAEKARYTTAVVEASFAWSNAIASGAYDLPAADAPAEPVTQPDDHSEVIEPDRLRVAAAFEQVAQTARAAR